ncbi:MULTISPECIES: hypothetical protein [unclassified Streptomyces]|uniref:hypothetical protein n=1 Tax=unclassified Streptomyces TaxID=2593676 RepID=UPI00381DC550
MTPETELKRAMQEADPRKRAALLAALLDQLEAARKDALTARDATARELHSAGASGAEIQRLLGISHGRVSQILSGWDQRRGKAAR